NPKDENAYFFRAVCNAKLMDLGNSISDYSQAIAINDEFAQAYLNRGNAKFKLNDKQGACEDWSKASELGYPNANNENYCKVYTASR
ncbi:MAG: pilus assembly protein PilF, partial [Bacteroidia bacterium]